jgi:hypothetical protein
MYLSKHSFFGKMDKHFTLIFVTIFHPVKKKIERNKQDMRAI